MKNKRYYVNKEIIEGSHIKLEGDEFIHLASVMRSRVGESVTLFNGDAYDYDGVIVEIAKKYALINVTHKTKGIGFPNKKVTLFQALVKGDKLSTIVQKNTELGTHEIVLFESDYSDVKVGSKNIEKLEKVSISACKQCGSSVLTLTGRELKFNQMIEEIKKYDSVLFAFECESENHISKILPSLRDKNNIAVIVGAEGGFSDIEAQKIKDAGAIVVNLGQRILRAETAGIVLPSLVILGAN